MLVSEDLVEKSQIFDGWEVSDHGRMSVSLPMLAIVVAVACHANATTA